MADLQTLWALMTGVATAPPFKLPTLDPATAFQMVTSKRVGGLHAAHLINGLLT